MRKIFNKKVILIIAALLAVQVTAFGFVFAAFAGESRGSSGMDTSGGLVRGSIDNDFDTGLLYDKIDTTAHNNRSSWLYELMSAAGYEPGVGKGDATGIFEQARDLGIISLYSEDDMYLPLDRRYVAYTMTRAFNYPEVNAGYISDITSDDSYMSAMAYFGYFLPDINNKIYPDSAVTAEEYESLMTELERYRSFRGKSILSFGDSIMYGTGNDGEGISDIIATKYGMTAVDLSVPGATLGTCSEREHIPDQLREAYSKNLTADIILINGGTNDVNHTSFGNIRDGFDMSRASETDFCGGFERTLWMLRTYWRDVPVIYIRAHNMVLGNDEREEKFGERAVEITSKWGVTTVDLYNEMNSEDEATRSRYTYLNPSTGYTCDAIHPNALGYAKFYLPPITEAMVSELS